MKLFGTGCTENTYGFECSQKCGKCRNRSQCNHVTGTCPKGCDKGKYGDECVSGSLVYLSIYPLKIRYTILHILSICCHIFSLLFNT